MRNASPDEPGSNVDSSHSTGVVRLSKAERAFPFTGERFVPGIVGDIAQEHLHRYLFALEFCRGKDVLDIASGEGYGTFLISGVARSVTGVDNDRDVVRHAKVTYGGNSARFVVGEAEQLPLLSGSVDVVVSFETLEHIAEQDRLVEEVKRTLRPGGVLIISTPHRPVYSPGDKSNNQFHVKELDHDEFRQLLSSNFHHVRLYRQKLIAGSCILPDQGQGTSAAPTVFEKDEADTWSASRDLPQAMYMIAVASDAAVDVPNVSLLIDFEKIHNAEAAAVAARANADVAAARVTAISLEADEARAAAATSASSAAEALAKAASDSERIEALEREASELRAAAGKNMAAMNGALGRATVAERLSATLRDQINGIEAELTDARSDRNKESKVEHERTAGIGLKLEVAAAQLIAEQVLSQRHQQELLRSDARFGALADTLEEHRSRVGLRSLMSRHLNDWQATPWHIARVAVGIWRNRMQRLGWYKRTTMAADNPFPAWLHLLYRGIWRDAAPHPLFDPKWYRGIRGSQLKAQTPAIADFLAHALSQKQSPHPLFDVEYYLTQVPQLLVTRENPLGHYLRQGHRDGLSPTPLFDSEWYRAQKPPGLRAGDDALTHFLEADAQTAASPHALFDVELYLAENPDVATARVNPLVHYTSNGGQQARRPHRLFDNAWYRRSYTSACEGWRSPLAQYLWQGERCGYWPNPLFDPVWYRCSYGASIPDGQTALAHYVTRGMRDGCWPNPLFDPLWYLEHNRDVREKGRDPLEHYLMIGERDHRRPNPFFDPDWYRTTYPEIAAGGVSPLRHYLVAGRLEGRRPSSDFDLAAHLREHPEAALAPGGAFAHFVQTKQHHLKRPAGEHSAAVATDAATSGPAGSGGTGTSLALPQVMALPVADGSWEWADCATISQDHAAAERRRIEAIDKAPIPIIEIAPDHLAESASRLSFAVVSAPLVSILVPVYNNIKLTLECLASIERNTRDVSYEVIVADDASTDETAALMSRLANVKHVRQPSNLNFLRNCNAAAKSARGRYLVILNNDAQVMAGWLAALVDAIEGEPGVGAVGPKFVYPNGRLQEAGAAINPDGTSMMIGLFDDPDLPRYNYRRQVDYVSGACLMLETTRFHEMGGFSESLAPAYCEDCDLCLRLRDAGLKIVYEPAAVVVHHLSKTTAALDDTFKMRAVAVNQDKLVRRWQRTIEDLNDVRLLAFYLPQFHPIAENDRWWGAGFTEWHNVGKAYPNFVGHYQPRRPADLGYYDLRMPEVMEQQASLAKRYGVAGFCYYYYWFAGKRLLERPIEQMLASGKPDHPFCLCWANENWSRRWDGENQSILIAQDHSPADDEAVITDLARYFRSPNYIRIDGRPLLLIYRVRLFPSFPDTVERWRKYCRANGIGEIYVATVEAFDQVGSLEPPERWGCDAGVEFPPHGFGNLRKPAAQLLNPQYTGMTDDYVELVHRYLERPLPDYRRFRGVMAGWDNTPRRQNEGLVFQNATPGAFQAWLEAVIAETRQQAHGDERLVFINAWNEWAEGAYLEPDMRFGHSWLEAVRNARDATWLTKK